MAKRRTCYSGIGGQAVLEGVMMKNGERYAVAVRKPDGGIEVELENYQGVLHGHRIKELPFVRGVFNFIDSLILGNKCLTFSASFYDEEVEETTDRKRSVSSEKTEKLMMTLVTVFSVVLAIGIFVVLPYYIASLMEGYVRNRSIMNIVEGGLRILIFLLYVIGISAMKDIRRLYQYHGAEHKCINCLERGRELTVRNVMRSSRLHKRCGTSFIFFVLFVSIILFFFIRVENPVERVALRILLMPVVAGISYEIIRLAGRSDNALVKLLSVPGMLVQKITTREPDRKMVEVAIASVEAVFDWKEFLRQNFGYSGEPLDGEAPEEPGELLDGEELEEPGELLDGGEPEEVGELLDGEEPEEPGELLDGGEPEEVGELLDGGEPGEAGEPMGAEDAASDDKR